MNTDNSSPDDELLSAYLDGELTEEQRAAVEQRLANDPAARKTLEALRGISAKVQALPQEPLGRDLKQQVLKQIQKEPSAILPQYDVYPETTAGQRRAWIWAGLAVAAALMLMFLVDPDRQQHAPVVAVDQKAELEKAVSAKKSRDADSKGDSARNELAFDQETAEVPAAREGVEEFGLAEVPDAHAELPSGEVADEVAGSRAPPAERMAVAPREGAAESRRWLEQPESDTLASQSSLAAPIAENRFEPPSALAGGNAAGVGTSERRDSLMVAASKTYELTYAGTPEETVRRFSQVLDQQGVVLRKTSLEERERLELDLLLSENQRQVEIDSWDGAASERMSPRLSKSGQATSSGSADESLIELDQEEPSETGEAQAAEGSEQTTQEAVLVEATPEQIDRVLATWKIVDKQERAQSLARSRSYGTQRYGDSPRGVSGGEFGGGGGGYGGRPTQDENQETTDQQTSWAMRFSVKSLAEPERNKSLTSSPAKSEIESSAKRKSENKNRRIRVLFYFRPTEAK